MVSESGLNPTLAPPSAVVGDVPPAWSMPARQSVDGVALTGPLRVQVENPGRALTSPGAMQAFSPTFAATRASAPQSALWPGLAAGLRDGVPVLPGDPQTPVPGARELARRMGAHLVTVDGGDHGRVAKGTVAVDRAVLDYLRTGRSDVAQAPAPPEPVAG